MTYKKNYKSAWRVQPRRVEKRWGYEIRWPAMPSIDGKILHIKAGESTSFKYYSLKNETLYILKGAVEITYGDELCLTDPVDHPLRCEKFVAGSGINIQSTCPYKITAIIDSDVLEIGDSPNTQKVKVQVISD
tara:strand:+ start:34114 stop:34512 length:399 start_codon:yes stop_codon:yes gene_type:complete